MPGQPLIKLAFFFALASMGMSHARGQLDNDFWFVAPEVITNHGDTPVFLRFATYNDSAYVLLDMPANDNYQPYSLAIPPNSVMSLDLTDSLSWYENQPFDAVSNKGIHVTSSANISAYYEVNVWNNPEIFSLKGQNALGSSFCLPYQNLVSNVYGNSTSGFDVVATEPNTVVTIVPTADLVGGHPAGVPYQVSLPLPGSTYAGRAASQWNDGHPSGTVITSNHPVAITIHDDSCNGGPFGGCTDLMGDQIVPTDLLGTEYIAIRGFLNGDDRVYVVATEDNTLVSVGGTSIGVLNAGETLEHALSDNAAYFTTSAPAAVWQMTGFNCELGAALLPSLTCTGSSSATFVRSKEETCGINLLVPSGGEGDFSFNGDASLISDTSFAPVPGTEGAWMFAQLNLGDTVPVLEPSKIANASHAFHLGIIHGTDTTGTRFGHFSDYGAMKYQVTMQTVHVCLDEPFAIEVNAVNNGLYQWAGPNGAAGEGAILEFPQATMAMEGHYVVSGSSGACDVESDSVSVVVHAPIGPPGLPENIVACEGVPLSLTGTGGTVTWLGPQGEEWNSATLNVAQPTPENAGHFIATLHDPWCPDMSDSVFVEVLTDEERLVTWDEEKSICPGEPTWVNVPYEVLERQPDIQWLWTPFGTTDALVFSIEGSVLIHEPGTYLVETTTPGPCAVLGQGEVRVELADCDLLVPNVITPGNDNKNNRFLVRNLDQFPYSTVRIFDRWGNEVYRSDDFGSTQGWLPPYDASPGVYHYMLWINRGSEDITIRTEQGTTEYSDPGPVKLHGSFTVFK